MQSDRIFIKLTNDEIKLNDLNLKNESIGASVIFVGSTRNFNNQRQVIKLEYSSYEPMAIKLLRELANEASELFELLAVHIVHRIGTVVAGEASVLIICASAHRKNCLRAADWLMDQIKLKVPIWKKEFYSETEYVWL